jgi:hypothetical protein
MGFEQPITTLTTIVGQPKRVNTNPVDELAKKLLKLSASEEDVVRGIREKFPNMTESAARMVIAEVKDPNRKGLNPKGFKQNANNTPEDRWMELEDPMQLIKSIWGPQASTGLVKLTPSEIKHLYPPAWKKIVAALMSKQNGWAETDIMPQLPSDRKRTKEPGYTEDLKSKKNGTPLEDAKSLLRSGGVVSRVVELLVDDYGLTTQEAAAIVNKAKQALMKNDSSFTKEPGYTEDLKNEDKPTSDEIVRDFLKEPNKLAKAIKNMPLNRITEPILSKLHARAEKVGNLSEQAVQDMLSPEERKYIYRQNNDSSFTKDLAIAERRGGSADKKNKDEYRVGAIIKLIDGEYGKIVQVIGDGRYVVKTEDGQTRVTDKKHGFAKNADRLKPTDVQSEVNSKKR